MEYENIIYVSLSGKTGASGTREDPVASLNEAVKLCSEGKGTDIVLLEGTYAVRDTVKLDESSNVHSITGEGNVVLSGGARIDNKKITEVKDAEMSARLPDASKVRAIDLSGLGLKGQTFCSIEGTPRFYVDGKYFENARFPNNERLPGRFGPYLYSEKINSRKDAGEIDFYYDGDEIKERMKRWSPKAFDDMRISGYIWVQWLQCFYRGKSADAENGILYANGSEGYAKDGESVGPFHRTFISDVAEELDVEGEYYFDKDKEILYFIPYSDYTDDTETVVSVSTGPALTIDNCADLTVCNIKFRYFRNTPVIINNSSFVTIADCEISHTTEKAAVVTKSYSCGFDSCDMFDLAAGAITFSWCGVRTDLTESEDYVTNCIFHDYNQYRQCYCPAVHVLNSCGIDIDHNTITDAPHQALLFGEVNNIRITDNVIRNCCRDTDDVGAIYWGRDPSELGIYIIGNFFADIGNTEADFNNDAIYIDDWATCSEICDNVFYNAGMLTHEKMTIHTNANAIDLNNAQFLSCHNNIFVNGYQDQKPVNLYPCPSTAQWMLYVNGAYPDGQNPSGRSWYEHLKEKGYFSEEWKNEYKHTIWAGMYDIINENTRKKLEDFFAANVKEGDEESYKKALVKLGWDTLDYTWDHMDEEGNYYAGTVKDYVAEKYADEIKDPSWLETNPLDTNDMHWVVFWKCVWHKLVFRTTNVFRNNITVGVDRSYLDKDEKFIGNAMTGFKENYNPIDDKLPDGSSMFVKYGEDFSLTEEGLRLINRVLPEFHNIKLDAGAKRD